jgi:TOBE domain
VRLPDEVRMTVLVPNADEAERGRLPGGGASVRLSWAPEHIHLVKESANTPSQGGD